jgi:hypothetical protein
MAAFVSDTVLASELLKREHKRNRKNSSGGLTATPLRIKLRSSREGEKVQWKESLLVG